LLLNAQIELEAVETHTGGVGGSAPTPVPGPQCMVFDPEGLLKRLMGDDHLAHKIITGFISTVPAQIVALAKAVSEGDAVTARSTAHSVKGSAAKAGRQELSEAAHRAERLGEAGDFRSLAAMLPRFAQRPACQRSS
jgi:HPt (histidine-containing phosphotransfer) domain-containing protein